MLSRIKALVEDVTRSALRPLERRLLPQQNQQLKRQIGRQNQQLKRQMRRQVVQKPLLLKNPYVAGKFYPAQGRSGGYIIPKPDIRSGSLGEDLPVPPVDLLMGYSPETYLATGRRDIDTMLSILESVGESSQTLTRVLELGCAGGRMLRFYPYMPEESELWGVDISARHVTWCQHNLSPPFLFAMSTTSPHLPFEDNYFDLVYCGSVFTHISELADTWFLELRRILRGGGYAYITIHDKRTIELLFTDTRYTDNKNLDWFRRKIRQFDKRTSVCSQDYASFSMGADPESQVFYDREYLVQKWSRFAKVLSVTPEAYAHQTAILVQK